MVCKNCGNKFLGNFCNNCGQKANVRRLNWQYLMHSINNNVFQIDHGFLYTINSLIRKPRQGIKDFFDGKRKNFQNPLNFLLITVSLYLIATKLLGNETFVQDAIRGMVVAGTEDGVNYNAMGGVDFILKNQTIIYLLTIPIFSIASFIAFYKQRFNFTEHLVLNTYVLGIQLLCYTFFSFLTDRTSLMILLPLGFGFLYNVYVYYQLFNQLSWWERILRFVLTYFFYYLLFSVIFIIILLIASNLN